MTTYKLPKGWTEEPFGSDAYKTRFLSLVKSGRGAITVDFELRTARFGWATTGDKVVKDYYTGRGWKQKLVDAAISAFEEIFVPRTDKPATANFPHDDMGTPV